MVLERGVDRAFELADVVGDEVGQIGVLRVTPPGLDRIEFRGVGGKLLERDALQSGSRDLLLRRTMDVPPIPDDDQRSPQPAFELLDEGDGVDRLDVRFLNGKRRGDLPTAGRERRCRSRSIGRGGPTRAGRESCRASSRSGGSPAAGASPIH